MHMTVSWAGGDVAVALDEGCRSVAALLRTVAAAVPELDAEKVCLEIGGCAADDEAVCGLCEGCVVTVSVTPAVRAAATLREEGHEVDCDSFRTAAEDGNLRLCRLYLEAGLVSAPCRDTPLHAACREGHLELCKVLIDGGLPANIQESHGNTSLHLAAELKSVELCQLLINSGCAIDVQNFEGNTPLHTAVGVKSVAVCKLLIDSGAATTMANNDGKTPLDCVSGSGDAIRKLLTRA